jgi:diguanylate cyclase (GGDEF)-like protein/PAS domain S-box-containing protein
MQSNQLFINNLNEARSEIRTLAKFPDDNPNPVIRVDSNKRIEYANIKAQELVLEPLGFGLGDTISEELYSNLKDSHTLSGRNEVEIGEKIFSFSISFIHDPEGIYFYAKDISRQKKFESLQLLSENIFSNSIEGIVITDSEGIIESVNPAFTKITGYTKEEAIGKNPRILKSHRHSREFYRNMWEQLHEKGFWSGEIWNRRKNGSVYPEYLTITSIKNEKGEVNQFISFFHDLSAVKEREDRIAYESTHDKLTGLPNRDFLVLEAERLIKNAEAVNEGFSFIYIDINNFKRVNESIGPEAGDLILIEASKRLDELFKNANSVIRIGGDEFVCILTGKTEAKEISYVLEDIIGIFKPAFYAGGREVNLEITLGVSTFPYDDILPLELLAKAEAAMRASKKDINSPYIFYSPSFRKEGLSRLEIESGLKTAFENQRFYLNYQPKVSALTGKIIGSEALVRLKPIEGQFIGPDIFIPVAEEIGLIEPLGAWVLEKACRDTKKLIEKGFTKLHVAVNLSPWQFRNAALSDQVSNIIASTGIPAANLNLEITESMAIDDVEESIRMMRKLTNIGLTLSIDDFGTGYSSLSYLSSFPVNVLKIDKAFVDGIPEDPKKTGVVLAILSLASNLGMETVAEGVENFEQYQFLKDRGCTMIQGYYFHKPLLIGDFEEAMRKES